LCTRQSVHDMSAEENPYEALLKKFKAQEVTIAELSNELAEVCALLGSEWSRVEWSGVEWSEWSE
jgi:putative methionine-R-sulfoxide reductase with GAF domain